MHSTLFLVLALSAVALARPSFVQFAQDGTSYSYNFQSPALAYNALPQQLLTRTQFLRTVVPQSSLVVGPAVSYNLGAIPVPTPVVGVPEGPAVVQAKITPAANIQLSADGFVLDTPEVAQAKAAHFAAVAQESSRNVAIQQQQVEQQQIIDDTVEVGSPVVAVRTAVPQQANFQFSAPVVAVRNVVPQQPANIQVSADGHVLDTPEVAQAKAEHFARFAAESARAGVRSGFLRPINVIESSPVQIVRNIEIADVKVGADGHLLDTPAVAQAKAAHFAQYNEEAARAIAAGGDTNDYSDESVVVAANPVVAVRGAYPAVAVRVNDAPADIKVSSDGFVLDTPEVASAKASHLATKAAIESTSTYVEPIPVAAPALAPVSQYIAYTGPSVAYTSAPVAYSAPVAVATAQTKWVGPPADIKVGADGFLIDTPEVQQARAEHLATRSAVQANSVSGVWAGATARYAAAPALTANGQYLLDTPEVASAKAAHFAAYNNEVAKNAAVSAKTLNYGQLVYSVPTVRTTVAPTVGYSYSPVYRFLSYRYAPTAAPVALTPDGQFLLDTPEVAAAKADHFAAHARARGF